MFDCFLTEMGTGDVIIDSDENVIYLLTQLKKITIDIVDAQGKFLPLHHLLDESNKDAMVNQWGNDPAYGTIAGAFQIDLGVQPLPPMIYTFNAGFAFGILFERIRARKGLKFTVTTEPLTSNEASEVLEDYKASQEGEPDDE